MLICPGGQGDLRRQYPFGALQLRREHAGNIFINYAAES